MIENSIHLMVTDNDGNDLTQLNDTFISKVCRLFGGASVIPGQGLWYSNNGIRFVDHVQRLIVAFDPRSINSTTKKANEETFLSLANEYKTLAKQESVYCTVSNKVVFL